MRGRSTMLGDLWPGLDLRHLAAFAAVAETRSFARAAAQLGYTQPAVSQQVAALETIVGQRLFDRSSGRADATLTEAGELLATHVADLTARLAVAHRDLLELETGVAGSLRVGAFQSALAGILPHVLRRYGAQRPRVRVECIEGGNDVGLLEELRHGTLDFAFALLPLDSDVFAYEQLLRDEFVLVSRAGDGCRATTLAELAELPLIVYRTCRSTVSLLGYIESQCGPANVTLRSDDAAAITEMVRAGLGVGVLPELWVRVSNIEGLELSSLEGVIPPRVVVLAWRRDRTLTSAQQAFVEVAAARPWRADVRLAS